MTYCGAWLDEAGADRLVRDLCARAGLACYDLPEGVRTRKAGSERFWFNHGLEHAQTPAGVLPPAGVLRIPD